MVEQTTVGSSAGCTCSSTTRASRKDALIYNMEPDDWLDVMRVNFGGVFNCTKAALPHFMGQRDGSSSTSRR